MNRCEPRFVCMNGLKDCQFQSEEKTKSGICTFAAHQLGGYFFCMNKNAVDYTIGELTNKYMTCVRCGKHRRSELCHPCNVDVYTGS